MGINQLLLNTLKTSRKLGILNDFYYDVALGNTNKISTIYKYGYNPEVSTTEFESVWNGGGFYTGFDAITAETIELFSSDDNDKPTGTGLGKVKLYGLDANYIEQTEEIELNGITSVITTKLFIRCDRIVGVGDGTLANNKVNLGTIMARQSITIANVFAQLPIGHNETMIACYTVPANKTAFLVSRGSNIAKKQSASVEIRMAIREYGEVTRIVGISAVTSTGSSFASENFKVPVKFPAKTDICIQAGNASAVTGVGANFGIILQG